MTPRDSARRARACAAVAALGQVAAERLLAARPPGGAARWARTNYAGRTVSLTGGAATALAVVAGSAAAGGRVGAAAALAGAAGGAAGLVDDLGEAALPGLLGGRRGRHAAEPTEPTAATSTLGAAKGLRGHLGALREGRLTTGALKIGAIGAGGLAAACLLPGPERAGGASSGGRPVRGALARLADVGLSTVVVAGTANLLNLLDLRPGRALKAGLLGAAPLLAAPGAAAPASAVVGAASASLYGDLGERTMLGDTGANALGAVLGTALAAGTGRPARGVLAAGIVALTLASEKVSFSAVIARTPGLRELDALGRA